MGHLVRKKTRIIIAHDATETHEIRLYSDRINEVIVEHTCKEYTHYWDYKTKVEQAIAHYKSLKKFILQ